MRPASTDYSDTIHCVLYTMNTSYCEGDSVSGDVSVRRLANVEPDCCCLCASKICVSAFMKGVISCREHKEIYKLNVFARNMVARCVPRLIMIPDPPLQDIKLNTQLMWSITNSYHYPKLETIWLKCYDPTKLTRHGLGRGQRLQSFFLSVEYKITVRARTAIPSLPSGVSPSPSLGPFALAMGRTISLVALWNCSTSAFVTSRLAESALHEKRAWEQQWGQSLATELILEALYNVLHWIQSTKSSICIQWNPA